MIQRCLCSAPSERPNIQELLQGAAAAFQMDDLSREGRLVDKFVHRLEMYSQSLEEEVRVRTDNLVLERKKCDNLLREILPRSVHLLPRCVE